MGPEIPLDDSIIAILNSNGRKYVPGQGNNVFIFPAMGLAVIATEAKLITDEMFICAAEALACQVSKEMFETGLIFPPIAEILKVSINVAVKISEFIFDNGLAGIPRPANIEKYIKDKVYNPVYN